MRMTGQRVGQELHDRHRRDRLAGAGLTDQSHSLALVNVKTHTLHGMKRTLGCFEINVQVFDLKKLFRHKFWCTLFPCPFKA